MYSLPTIKTRRLLHALGLMTILGLASCSSSSESERPPVTGGYSLEIKTLKGVKEGNMYFLKEVTQSGLRTLDSLPADKEGRVVFTGKVETPGFYMVVGPDIRHQETVILDNSAIKMTIATPDTVDNSAKFEGSALMDSYLRMAQYEVATQNAMDDFLSQKKQEGKYNPAEPSLSPELLKEIEPIGRLLKENLKSDFKTKGIDFAAVYYLQYFELDNDFALLDSVNRVLKTKYPGNPFIVEFAEKLQASSTLRIGAPAPAITLPDPSGKVRTLQEFAGKYLLVDFWASWCGPCRRTNPELVALYKSMKGRNFEILGVSLDRDKEPWLKAIESDGLTWPQVSDLKYWESAAAKAYQVESIPCNFLISPEGKLLGRDLGPKEINALVK